MNRGTDLNSLFVSDIFKPFGRLVYQFGHPNSGTQKTLQVFFFQLYFNKSGDQWFHNESQTCHHTQSVSPEKNKYVTVSTLELEVLLGCSEPNSFSRYLCYMLTLSSPDIYWRIPNANWWAHLEQCHRNPDTLKGPGTMLNQSRYPPHYGEVRTSASWKTARTVESFDHREKYFSP